MNWQKNVVRKTLELAGEHKGVQLQILLERLEAYPDAWPAIVEATRDMARWSEEQGEALSAELARREARNRLAEIVNPKK